jgi:hypothetical protein
MPARQVVLLRILVFALTVFLCLAAWRPEWSQTNIVSLVAFSVMLVVIAFLTLAVRNGGSLDGHRGLPRSFWVVFASLTGAFGLAMLLAILGCRGSAMRASRFFSANGRGGSFRCSPPVCIRR